MLERTRRTVGFIEPCLFSSAKAPPGGPDWLHEIKRDGLRILARRDATGVRLFTRNGYNFAERFSLIVAAIAALPARSYLIDGGAIVSDDSGHAVFELIRRQHRAEQAVRCAFDLLELDGQELRRLPIEDRRARLAGRLRKPFPRHRLEQARCRRPPDHNRASLQARLRGHRVKAARLVLSPGSSKHCLKVKNPPAVQREAEKNGISAVASERDCQQSPSYQGSRWNAHFFLGWERS